MILSEITVVRSHEERIAWASLQRYQNVSSVTDSLMRLHALPADQRKNAQKQARQIRTCLIQAREYASAARVVTLATKPTLLYYAIMNLALAEMLLKQSGDSSLDRAREQHRHHGLLFTDRRAGTLSETITASAAGLTARPMIVPREHDQQTRMGTFELWHSGAREAPLVGTLTSHYPTGGTTFGTRALAFPKDARLPLLSPEGLSLLECFAHIPDLIDFLGTYGVVSECVRCAITRDDHPNDTGTLRFTVHPSRHAKTVLDGLQIHPALVDRLQFLDLPSGGVVSISSNQVYPDFSMELPPGCASSTKELRCWVNRQVPLNEFGYIYVALFIAGNYARYYPDRWVVDVENSTPLALAVEELLGVAERRVPWLTLSELSRSYHVFDA